MTVRRSPRFGRAVVFEARVKENGVDHVLVDRFVVVGCAKLSVRLAKPSARFSPREPAAASRQGVAFVPSPRDGRPRRDAAHDTGSSVKRTPSRSAFEGTDADRVGTEAERKVVRRCLRRISVPEQRRACGRYESGGWILELRSRRQRGGVEPAAVGLPRCEGPSRLLPILETVAQIVILVRVGRYWQAEAET